jgi:outer membrane receptor protein involved in Fe transport
MPANTQTDAPARLKRALIVGVGAAALAVAGQAQTPAPARAADATPAAPAPAPPTDQPIATSIAPNAKATTAAEIVVNGIPYKETVLPTRMTSSSVYGLDLGVMDTPRNTTLLSTTQLDTLNIQDPRAFSYLTSSSYTDSAFGTPNIPRIRGQYADVFYNGMRSSFTDNGYGAPLNFDSFDNIAITKGPASVIDGPGPGVGGEVDLLTKRPSLSTTTIQGEATFDTLGNNRWSVDVSGPIIPGTLGLRIDYSGEDSWNTYFYDHYMRKNAVYAALRWTPNDKYQVDFNTEIVGEKYTEEVGINRVNQNLIDNTDYLQGAPVQGVTANNQLYAELIGSGPIPIGSTGNPYSPVTPILTVLNLTNSVPFNTRVTLDQTPGVESQALLYNAQLIQTYRLNDNVTLQNNTFFDFQNSENHEPYYYADVSNGSWTIENRTNLNIDFDLPFSFDGDGPMKNQMVVGGTFRFAHVNYISDFSAETVSVYDLTSNHNLWSYSAAYQLAFADAFPYKTPFGSLQYGVPGRDETDDGNTGISDLYDGGLFVQDRLQLTQKLSLLIGGRIDFVQDNTTDPLGGAICEFCFTDNLPQSHSTGVYGLGNGNVSAVYKPFDWISGYLTFDFTQSVNPNGGEGGVNAYGQVADHTLLQSDSYLYEAGLKVNLLDNKLFGGLAIFDQQRSIPTGFGGTIPDQADIRGVEIEANYQPTRSFFATASYSFIKTTLNTAPEFYNYPAQLGTNVDGAALFASFAPGEKFNDPGVPQHVFNFLGNYKFSNGLGLRLGTQVTGPIATTPSGWLNVAASNLGNFLPLVPSSIANGTGANGYAYYQSPVIPWQFTLNAAVFYEWSRYTVTLSVYNFTNQRNWEPSPSLYGNDFLVMNDPITAEIRLQAKF